MMRRRLQLKLPEVSALLVGLFVCLPAAHSQTPLSQEASERWQKSTREFFALDPILGIRALKILFGLLKAHCVEEYPNMREALDEAWASSPYMAIDIQILVNGQPYDNDEGVRSLISRTVSWASKTQAEKQEVCTSFGPELAAASATPIPEQIRGLLPQP